MTICRLAFFLFILAGCTSERINSHVRIHLDNRNGKYKSIILFDNVGSPVGNVISREVALVWIQGKRKDNLIVRFTRWSGEEITGSSKNLEIGDEIRVSEDSGIVYWSRLSRQPVSAP
jgi:hypothetical protein